MAKSKNIINEIDAKGNPIGPLPLNAQTPDAELEALDRLYKEGKGNQNSELDYLSPGGDKVTSSEVIGSAEDAVAIYDMIKKNNDSASVTFVSDITTLNVQTEVIRRNHIGQLVREHKVFEFNRGQKILTDPYEIEALRRSDGYGGIGDADMGPRSSMPSFWEGKFPTWKTAMMKAHADQLRDTRYEPVEFADMAGTL